MYNVKLPDNLYINECPHKTAEKEENWETASKFLGMIFGISEEKRKEWTEKAKNDYYENKSEGK